jgi:hypothetical protein|tara:strand:+ start:290 stop:985 length:696 start_codon:yes stop_codon:yes gene_type:complete
MPPCGFGNRLLYYYNLRQEAKERDCKFLSVPWSGHDYFEGDLLGKPELNEEYEVLNFCLGDRFYKYNNLSTREVFKLKKKPRVKDNTCAVHFRGTDFHSWNPDSILDSQYYYDAIEKVVDQVSDFILFTDDESLRSYANVIELLDRHGVDFKTGENVSNRSHYIKDFAIMSECDWIISSPSTFCITSGFIGKSKKIIHSKKWIKNRIDKEDVFWKDLYNGGNQNYSLWEVI